MFDFSFAELALVIVVAVVFIGPKELPVVVRAIARVLRHIRAFTREIRGAMDELGREAGLTDADVTMIKGDDGKFYESYPVPKAPADDVK